jgi:hypothetical protein
METLTHSCPQCGTLLQYRAASEELPFQCPACGAEDLLPRLPRPEDAILQEQLEDIARRQKQAKSERKQWQRVRLGLGVLCVCGWPAFMVLSVGLLGFVDHWLGRLWAWSNARPDAEFLAIIGLALALFDVLSLAGYRYCLQGPPSAGLRPWIRVTLAVAALRNLACVGSGVLVLAFGLAPAAPGPRLVVAAAGGLFLAQWVAQMLLVRAVAHALHCAWLMRRIHNWLFLLLGNLVVGGIVWLAWPAQGPAPSAGLDWLGATLWSVFGLAATALAWLCCAWQLRILHVVRSVTKV